MHKMPFILKKLPVGSLNNLFSSFFDKKKESNGSTVLVEKIFINDFENRFKSLWWFIKNDIIDSDDKKNK